MTGGSINVSVPGLDAATAPVEVLDRRLGFVRHATSGAPIELPEGRYVVAVTLPDGGRRTELVEVRPGRSSPVVVDWERRADDDLRARTRSRTSAKSLLKAVPDSFALRFVTIAHGLAVAPAPASVHKSLRNHSSREGVFAAALDIRSVAPRGVHFAEVRADGFDRTVVALPVAKVGEAERCLLDIAMSPERLEVEVRMGGVADADAIAEFMASGQIHAAAVPRTAERLLYGKLKHPFAAALGGYALLRVRELDRLHNWPKNLARLFDWLPDGHVIVGEQRLRHGSVPGAAAAFVRAVETGLPVFTDGFSILQARLRSLSSDPALPQAVRDDVRGSLDALARWTPWVAFDRVFTTLRPKRDDGADGGGWQRFRPPFGQARDESDYWSDLV